MSPQVSVSWLTALVCFALLAAATGCDALVGGHCAEGYFPGEGRCVPLEGDGFDTGATGGGGFDPGDNAPGGRDAGAGGGDDGCAPLSSCAGGCVDFESNPNHCGGCGLICDSGLCVDGACEGDPAGHAVVVGMSFDHSTPATRRLLGNALFLPLADPLRVLEYRGHTPGNLSAPLASLIAEQAALRGRVVQRTVVTSAKQAADALDTESHEVFLVADQPLVTEAQANNAATILEPAVTGLTSRGGVVVILATDRSEGMPALLSGLDLLAVAALEPIDGATLHNVVPTDALAVGVPSVLSAPEHSSSLIPEAESPSWVTVFATDEQSPVVLHRVFLP